MNIKRQFKINGFSLIELSIVLIIISLLISASILAYNNNNDLIKINQTNDKLKIIEQAIIAFLAINNRLPCAASLTITTDNSNSGLEQCSCNDYLINKISNLPTTPVNFDCPDSNIIVGAIPYQTLSLPKEFLTDAWGNKIIYVVTKGLTGNNSSCSYGSPNIIYNFNNCNMGLVSIYDANNKLIVNNAAYGLLSTGINGLGSFSGGGVNRSTIPVSVNELINYNVTNNGNLITQEYSHDFDDIIKYRMKWQLIKDVKLVISNSVCSIAEQISKTPEVNIDSVNYFYLCNDQSADPKCALYFNQLVDKINNLCLNH